MLEHSYGERCHPLRHREDVSTDVDNAAALDASAIVKDHVDPLDAQPTVIGEFAEPVDGRVQPHHLMLKNAGLWAGFSPALGGRGHPWRSGGGHFTSPQMNGQGQGDPGYARTN